MLSTYNYGDAVLVKKIIYEYAKGDVVYFEYPQHDSVAGKTFLCQRLVALPGDTFELKDKQVFVNSVLLKDDSTCRHNYFIKSQKTKLDSMFRREYNLTEGGEISDEFDYSYSLTRYESEALRKDSLVKSAELKTEKKNSYDETCFPWSTHYTWNMDQYGKLYIPKINDTLRLDTINMYLYRLIITDYEKNKLDIKYDSIFINGQLSTFYIVKKNYYFVMGDNRDNANDSRTWGFLPENFIKGRIIKTIKRSKK